jgi:hypothetical protein
MEVMKIMGEGNTDSSRRKEMTCFTLLTIMQLYHILELNAYGLVGCIRDVMKMAACIS